MSPENKTNTAEKINVLYIDDEVNNLDSFKAAFRRDYNVFTAISAHDGLQVLNQAGGSAESRRSRSRPVARSRRR